MCICIALNQSNPTKAPLTIMLDHAANAGSEPADSSKLTSASHTSLFNHSRKGTVTSCFKCCFTSTETVYSHNPAACLLHPVTGPGSRCPGLAGWERRHPTPWVTKGACELRTADGQPSIQSCSVWLSVSLCPQKP